MKYYSYAIYSPSFGVFYYGYTDNLAKACFRKTTIPGLEQSGNQDFTGR